MSLKKRRHAIRIVISTGVRSFLASVCVCKGVIPTIAEDDSSKGVPNCYYQQRTGRYFRLQPEQCATRHTKILHLYE